MSKHLVLSNGDDDVDNLELKKRITIADSDVDDEDDCPCYNLKDFNLTCRKLFEIGYGLDKATELTKQLYRHVKLTDIAVPPTQRYTINDTLHFPSTAMRSVSFNSDVPPAGASTESNDDNVKDLDTTSQMLRRIGWGKEKESSAKKRPPTTFEYSCAATAKCIIIVL